MSSGSEDILMIPGPTEFHPKVMEMMGSHSLSHTDGVFIKEFGEALTKVRKFLHGDEDSQPFIMAGSGSLGWDMIAANLTKPGDHVLVLNGGYFGERFVDCLKTYGCTVSEFKLKEQKEGDSHIPPFDLKEFEAYLKSIKSVPTLVTITQVDTSTGQLANVKEIASLIRQHLPKETLIAVDGVCSIGGEEFLFSPWQIDVLMTASQKGFGTPAGLSIQLLSKRALELALSYQQAGVVRSFYGSYARWLPIMRAYEKEGRPSYFCTPAVHLVRALNVSLSAQLSDYETVVKRHREQATSFRNSLVNNRKGLAISFLTSQESDMAHTMTAIRCKSFDHVKQVLTRVRAKGIILAGGLISTIPYVRVGHMGYSVLDPSLDHLKRVADAIIEAWE